MTNKEILLNKITEINFKQNKDIVIACNFIEKSGEIIGTSGSLKIKRTNVLNIYIIENGILKRVDNIKGSYKEMLDVLNNYYYME